MSDEDDKDPRDALNQAADGIAAGAERLLREKVVGFLRARAAEAAGKTWYHPDAMLEEIARVVEDDEMMFY